MALTHTDLRSDALLKEQGFTAEDIEFMHELAQAYWTYLVEYDEAEQKRDWDAHNRLEGVIQVTEFQLLYRGLHPREIPFDALVAITRAPLDGRGDVADQITAKYKERIHNPATAMRANCVVCMGGSTAEIRRCGAVNCPQWPFRLGTNPLRNAILPPVALTVIEDDDVLDIDESTDSGDASE
jgi:hypothetical protein